MTFQTAVRTCLSKYVDFQGRARRPEYWWFILFVVLGSLVLGTLDAMIFGTTETGDQIGILSAIFSLAVVLPSLAVAIRRLHDTDRSGWWILLGLIPVVGFLVLLYFYVQKGTEGDNRFGPEPPA